MIIYKATNKLNNKVYIGQTIRSLEYRKNQHLRDSQKEERRKNKPFHNAIAKYGIETFEFEVIDTATTQDELDKKEIYWIAYYDSTNRDKGYNRDSGGRKGGTKSDITKKLIGETTKQKWQDAEMAQKMREGLRKGNESWQQICRDKRIPFTCPICGKELMINPCELKTKRTCSRECSSKLVHPPLSPQAMQQAKDTRRKHNLEDKEPVKEYIKQWCMSNSNLVQNIPMNKITTVLKPMLDEIQSSFGIKDIRSLFVIYNVDNRKDFVKALQSIIS